MPPITPLQRSSIDRATLAVERAFSRLLSDGVVPGDMVNPYNVPWFFKFREEILRAITDPEIRNLTF